MRFLVRETEMGRNLARTTFDAVMNHTATNLMYMMGDYQLFTYQDFACVL